MLIFLDEMLETEVTVEIGYGVLRITVKDWDGKGVVVITPEALARIGEYMAEVLGHREDMVGG